MSAKPTTKRRTRTLAAITADHEASKRALRKVLDEIAKERAALDAREAMVRAALGEPAAAPTPHTNGSALGIEPVVTWQCFDCDGKIPAVEPMPSECPICGVAPFEVRK